jgi:hypothetical protein
MHRGKASSTLARRPSLLRWFKDRLAMCRKAHRRVPMKLTYYTADTLEHELHELEERYGMASQEFFEVYCASDVPPGIPGPDGFRWADTFTELCRLRATVEPQPA